MARLRHCPAFAFGPAFAAIAEISLDGLPLFIGTRRMISPVFCLRAGRRYDADAPILHGLRRLRALSR
jgi:hypothetical protein